MMKKIIYLCLFALMALNIACDKDEILLEELNQNSNNVESVEELEKGKLPQQDGTRNGKVNYARGDIGFGDSDGKIFDGSNNSNTPPNESYWTLLTEYPTGTTEAQKAAMRIPYQINGQLLYYEQCPNDPNKELWYMFHDSNVNPPHPIDPLDTPKGDPAFPTTAVVDFYVNQTCTD